MTHHKYLLMSLLFLGCLSCVSKKGDLDVLEIDVSHPKNAYLDDLADCQKIIPIQEDSSFDVGNINYSKSYGNMIFLYNDALRKINCIDEDGKPLFSLNALGRGEGEYIDIGTFTYNAEAKRLEIFERATHTIKTYVAPSMIPGETRQLSYYISAMDWIKGNTYAVIREATDAFSSDSSSIAIYDADTDKFVDSIHVREDQADTEDPSISRMSQGEGVFVTVPGAANIIYSLTGDRIVPSFSFRMSPDYLTEKKYWEGKYDESKYDLFCSLSDEADGRLAAFPLFYAESSGVKSFYYITGEAYYYHSLPDLNFCVVHGDDAKVYDSLTIKGIDTPISPIGVHNGKYVALLETEVLEYSGEMGEIAKEIKQAQDDGAEHIIVLYSFK